MTVPSRMTLILALMLPVGAAVHAQQTTAQEPASAVPAATSTVIETDPAAADAAVTTTTATTAADSTTTAPAAAAAVDGEGDRPKTSYEIRNQFSNLLRQHPYNLATILVLDPALLRNQEFISGYPELQAFLTAHPEVQRNPTFFLGEFVERGRTRSMLEEVIETLVVSGTMLVIAFALAWLVRTIIEQKRWNRLARTQTEVHNKILDRFATSDELLNYVRSPAGSKFLESAPIPLYAEDRKPRTQNAPHSRIMWSIQLGVVLAVAAIGMLLASLRFEAQTAQDLFAMGVIAFCMGIGFIASAVVSIVLSQRLGVWQGGSPAGGPAVPPIDDPGAVR